MDATALTLIIFFPACLFTSWFFWRTSAAKPLKLLSVLVHELGHVLTVWACCGRVVDMDINHREGGEVTWQARSRLHMFCASHIVLPAGYWATGACGNALILSVTNIVSVTVGASLLICLFALTLLLTFDEKGFKQPLQVIFWMLFVAVCLVVAWTFDTYVLLAHVLFNVGVFMVVYSVYDVFDDSIRRNIAGTDAAALAAMYPRFLTSTRVGVIWILQLLAMSAATVYGLLLLMRASNNNSDFNMHVKYSSLDSIDVHYFVPFLAVVLFHAFISVPVMNINLRQLNASFLVEFSEQTSQAKRNDSGSGPA